MKNRILAFTMFLAVSLILGSCAEEFVDTFEPSEKPEPKPSYDAELDSYDVLKNYIDRDAYPNFKLGLALEAADFNKKGQYYLIASNYFDEITAGNAMKYASCVDDNGKMDFSTVAQFIDAAKSAGLTIYGHTLAWHSQQRPRYLNGLIADQEVDSDPDERVDVEDASFNYSDYNSYPFYEMDEGGHEIKDGCLVVTPKEATEANWQRQYFVADWITLKEGVTYTITARLQGSADGSLDVVLGTWSASANSRMEFTTEMQEVSAKITAASDASGDAHILFQSGLFEGEIRLEWIKITHPEAPAVEIFTPIISNGDAEGTDTSCFKSTEFGGQSVSDCIIVDGAGVDGSRAFVIDGNNNANVANDWDTQFFVRFDRRLYEGDKIHVSFKYRADKAAESDCQTHVEPGTYIYYDGGAKVNFTTNWQVFDKRITISASQAGDSGMQAFAWNLAKLREPNKYYFDDIEIEIITSGNTIPLEPEEKKEILTDALDRWIAGMMNACEGFVTTWDVVNEAIAGGGDDGRGFYPLQTDNGGTSDFFWQDYLGSEDYVRIAVASARKHFEESGGNPADLKLFINDYNLESDWDDNKKLRSLINWIQVWESDGVTKIDGIGSQMHVSFYADPNTQRSKEAHVVRMLELMRDSKKLVKLSELDMGYVDTNGTSLTTDQLTVEQHKQMAEYYRFIIRKYFEIIPADQQYGITQWCATDSPDGSGWRAGEPVGLWDLSFTRKWTYAGFAEGLAGAGSGDADDDIAE